MIPLRPIVFGEVNIRELKRLSVIREIVAKVLVLV